MAVIANVAADNVATVVAAVAVAGDNDLDLVLAKRLQRQQHHYHYCYKHCAGIGIHSTQGRGAWALLQQIFLMLWVMSKRERILCVGVVVVVMFAADYIALVAVDKGVI